MRRDMAETALVPDHNPACCETCGHAVDDNQSRCMNLVRHPQSRRESPHAELVRSTVERHIQAEAVEEAARNNAGHSLR